MNTNTKTIVALAAVVAISAILVGSVIAEDAMARRCRHNGGGDRSQSISQAAVSGNGGQSQNIANQQQGNGNSAAIVGIQNRD
jgi:hypothetical protein